MTRPRRQAKRATGARWEGVESQPYKSDAPSAATYRNLSRQVLFDHDWLACQIRYFEVEPGGHTTLERHGHAHAVIVLDGRGTCLIGDEIFNIDPHDLIDVAPWEWHQFRAAPDQRLGFLCVVNRDRDRPQLPTGDDLHALEANPTVAAFLRGKPPSTGPAARPC